MAKLKLEVGRYYRTRDGRKVGPMRVHRDGDCMASEGEKETGLWNFDGSPFFSFAYDSPQLISIWTDTPEVGTLAEIRAQVGDVVACYNDVYNGQEVKITKGFEDWIAYDMPWWRIIYRASDQSTIDRVLDATQGPVVTETVKRIVPGVYGRVRVSKRVGGVCISMDEEFYCEPADLTEAIATLTAIRDAL